jgi:hypothetical protein
MRVGVCTCTGALYKKTFAEAWAAYNDGKHKDITVLKPDHEVCQCDKCNKIYSIAQVQAMDIELDQTDASRKDFGHANGRA